MPSSHEPGRFVEQLLRQDKPLSESEYKEYRMNLERALATTERREKLVGRVAAVSLVVGVVLMFVGGSKVIGSFDPWDADASIVSVVLGAVYWLAVVAALFTMASYYSRFRPRVREIKDQIRDANILALQSEIAELWKQVTAMTGGNGPTR